MSLITSPAKKEKARRAAHILAGGIILMHAYEKFESMHNTWPYFLVAGCIFISLALFHHSLKRKFPWIDNVFFCIEASLSFLIAYEYFQMGKKGLPYMFILAGVLQLSAIYFLNRKGLKKG